MSVHKELAAHAEKQNKLYQEFLQLDQLREKHIEDAITLCKQGESFSTNRINEVTNRMNRIPLRFIPSRKNVTVEMVKGYVQSLERRD